MSDEQFDEQVRRLRAERDRLKALPAEPDRCEEQLTGDLYADFYRALPRVRARRVADLARVRDPRHEERGQRDPGRREGDSSPRVIKYVPGQPRRAAGQTDPGRKPARTR